MGRVVRKLICLGVAAALAGGAFVALSRGDRGTVCGQSGGAAAAQGAPKMAPAAYYAWHDGRGWHLRIKGNGRSTVTGGVSADAGLGLVRSTSGIGRVLKVHARSF